MVPSGGSSQPQNDRVLQLLHCALWVLTQASMLQAIQLQALLVEISPTGNLLVNKDGTWDTKSGDAERVI
jgi:hypothetical protein